MIHFSTNRLLSCYHPQKPDYPKNYPDFWRIIRSHPLNDRLFEESGRAWKISDCVSGRRFKNSELYTCLYKPFGVDCELSACLQDPVHGDQFFLLTLHRHRSDFTERDRSVINLLLPHLSQVVWIDAEDRAAWLNLRAQEPKLELFRSRIANAIPGLLTRREVEVVYWLHQGKRNSEIGRILGISERTAETHALRAYPKLGVENRYGAIATLNRFLERNDIDSKPSVPFRGDAV